MIPWRGRLSFRTYNPAKIIKYGLLVRAVCESKHGYVINLEIYCAKGRKLQDTTLSVLALLIPSQLGIIIASKMLNYYYNIKLECAVL
ncbi:hypothetical protein WH47_06013 [Habropoda laboriosa]|uniref:PiggyBac transposable element-derived protein domain-containing protein n=1 Tax=Habropoda laboriosa TaxID=597456 RepID=A0A0L7REV7_9HYME|nr:hypothetical protein WH47_06013 [Habropoda laboriosa]